MANEARIQVSLQITKGNLNFRSYPTAFMADIENGFGPSPGAITVTPEGVDVDLSVFTEPGWALLINLDEDNYVDYGLYDADSLMFYFWGRLKPGMPACFELSPRFGEQHYDTGTSTSVSDSNNRLRFIANNANCNVLVNIFDN